MTTRLRAIIGALATLLHTGCLLSPLPEPPQARLDPSRVVTSDPWIRGAGLSGGPGAASPAGALVRVFNLDGEEDPAEGLVADDGSFSVELLVGEGQELRLQVVTDQRRSAPLDVVTGAPETSPVPAERPLARCLLLDPAAELDLETTGAVVVENRCAQDVELLAPRTRRPLDGVELGAERSWPFVVSPGEAISVEARVQPGFEVEEVFFLEASSPERDRRPLTLVPPP